jgi:trigger factor
MATITRENIAPLNDKLTVKIFKQDYYPAFESAIKNYSKKANIPGFRKGMVPAGMVKKMYGASIFYDEVIRTVEKEIQNYMSQEKPDIFAQPLPMQSDLRNLDMNNPADYDFNFEIGLKPQFEIPDLATLPVVLHQVTVTDDMVREELERLKTRHGKMTNPETVNSDDNVLNLKFTEVNENGEPIEGGIEKDNSLLLKYFSESIRPQLMGKAVGDTIIIRLNEAFEGQERSWIINDLGLNKDDATAADKSFKLTITKIGLVEKAELNQELFKAVFPEREITSEEDFLEHVRNYIQAYWDAQSHRQLQDQLYHIFLDAPIDFPVDFLKRWLRTGGDKPKTEEEVEAEYPTFEAQLKWTLISDRLIRENEIEVTEEEIREHIKRDVMQYFGQMGLNEDTEWLESYLDRITKDEKQVDSAYRKVITQKVFDWAADQTNPTVKEVTPEELNAMQHNH